MARRKVIQGQAEFWPDDTILLPLFSGTPVYVKATSFTPSMSASQGSYLVRGMGHTATLSEYQEEARARHDTEDPGEQMPDRVADARDHERDIAEYLGMNEDEDRDAGDLTDDQGNPIALSESEWAQECRPGWVVWPDGTPQHIS